MAVAVITEFDNKHFTLNGVKYVRNFLAIKRGSFVRVANAYDTRFTAVSAHYSEYTVNGLTYNDAATLVSVLSSILFVKDELIAQTPLEATNGTVTAIFNNVQGHWVNTPDTPGSGNIILDLTGAKNGGIAAVYYSGAVIAKSIFIGGTIVFLSGANNLNELCLVFLMYDKGSGGFSVNILTGATGDLPSGPGPITETTPILAITDQVITETTPILQIT